MDPQTVSNEPQIQHTFENPITPHRKINWLLVIIIVVGVFGLLGMEYFLGTRIFKPNNEITWEEAVRLIQNCQVKGGFQGHDLKVYLYLNDGSQRETREPGIDMIFGEVDRVKTSCPPIGMATE